MTVYVCVRSLPGLRTSVENANGNQADIARRAGLSKSRLNQLLSGARITVGVGTAAALEDAIGVTRGTLFGTADPDLVAPYATPPYEANCRGREPGEVGAA